MEAPQTQRLRYAVIGAGAGVMKSHRPALTLPEIDLVALSDIKVATGQTLADELGSQFYRDYTQMLRSAKPDVAVILTPPYLHESVARDCLQAGCHVLVEKPMAIQIAEADVMIETASQCQRLLAVVFQQRFRPEIIATRKLLQEGFLGHVQRVEATAVWTRSDVYYALAPWRATWRGEGGGVLTNQASHTLDLLCYLFGSPERVFAWTRRLLHKKRETEDTAQIMVEWPGGALGSIHVSTAEADENERIKIVGTKGSLEIGHGSLQAYRMEIDLSEYAITNQQPYGHPQRFPYALALESGEGDHTAVYRSLHKALSEQKSGFCDGLQGRRELELANAVIYSSFHHCEVELPLDPRTYSSFLADLQAKSQQ